MPKDATTMLVESIFGVVGPTLLGVAGMLFFLRRRPTALFPRMRVLYACVVFLFSLRATRLQAISAGRQRTLRS